MTRPPVTVVVPTHNRPEYLRRAVQSVVDQEYDGVIEVVVVFDASEPLLPDVPLRPGRHLRATTNDRTRGLAGARNTGILEAAHEYVAFLDDDDSWLPGKLESQLAVFEGDQGLALVGTAMVVDDGERRHERLVPSERIVHGDLIQNRLPGLHSSSFVFRRAALLGAVGLVDEALPRSYGEDYDMLLRTAAVGPIAVVNRPLVAVTWQGQSFFFGQWAVYAEALQYLLAKHPAFATSRTALGRIEAQVAFALAASGQRRAARDWAARSIRHDPRRPKAYLAFAVSLGVLSADRVARIARRFGKGI